MQGTVFAIETMTTLSSYLPPFLPNDMLGIKWFKKKDIDSQSQFKRAVKMLITDYDIIL